MCIQYTLSRKTLAKKETCQICWVKGFHSVFIHDAYNILNCFIIIFIVDLLPNPYYFLPLVILTMVTLQWACCQFNNVYFGKEVAVDTLLNDFVTWYYIFQPLMMPPSLVDQGIVHKNQKGLSPVIHSIRALLQLLMGPWYASPYHIIIKSY